MDSYQSKIKDLKRQIKTYERELAKIKDRAYLNKNKTIERSIDRVILAYESRILEVKARIKNMESEL